MSETSKYKAFSVSPEFAGKFAEAAGVVPGKLGRRAVTYALMSREEYKAKDFGFDPDTQDPRTGILNVDAIVDFHWVGDPKDKTIEGVAFTRFGNAPVNGMREAADGVAERLEAYEFAQHARVIDEVPEPYGFEAMEEESMRRTIAAMVVPKVGH